MNTQTLHIQALINTMNQVNIMPKIGWASSTLPTKLGGANSRSMGTPNCGWLPTRTDNNSLPGPCAPSNKVFTREQGPDNLRGSRTTGQRGNLGDATYTTELCVSNFPGGKKGWGSETCDKPKGSQSICEDRALQDGRPSPTPRSLTATRLDGKDGSEGCLPSDPYSCRPSTPSHLPMGREDLTSILVTPYPQLLYTCTVFTKHWCVAVHYGYQFISYLLEFTIHTYQKHYTYYKNSIVHEPRGWGPAQCKILDPLCPSEPKEEKPSKQYDS